MQIEKNENHFINTVLICSYFSIAQEKEIKAVLEKQRLD
jgi:hypothetical protein